MVIWCAAGWCHRLERERVCCLLLTYYLFGVYDGILCTLFSDWFGEGGVMLSRSGVAAVMGGNFGVIVMRGIVTIGNDGATLGGETGSCFDAFVGNCCCGWTVARFKNSASWSNTCI